jgi:hypothetical protein
MAVIHLNHEEEQSQLVELTESNGETLRAIQETGKNILAVLGRIELLLENLNQKV